MSVSFLAAAQRRAADVAPAAPSRPKFLGEDRRKIWDVYVQKDILGTGAFGTVYRAQEKTTGTIMAVKQLQKEAAAEAGAEADKEAFTEYST